MEEKNNFKSNFIWNFIGVGFNAFLSLFFLVAVTRINGLNDAGIFTLAFSTACIVYVIGIYAGRVFQVTESKSISDKEFIINRIISCIIMMVITTVFVGLKQYNFYKSIIFVLLALYKCLEAFSDVLYGIMQKNDLLNKVGKSYFIKAITSITIFILCDYITHNLILSCCCIVIVWIMVIISYDIINVKKIIMKQSKCSKNNILNIFKSGFFVFAITFFALYILNAPKYAIDSLGTEKMQAIFGIIIMPATVMGLIGQLLIHPYLNKFLKYYEENDIKKYVKLLIRIALFILILGIVFSICAYLLGALILGLIYNINLEAYSFDISLILIAGTLYTIASIISSLLIMMRNNFIQFVVCIIISIIEGSLCYYLVLKQELFGATLAYLSSMALYFVLLTIAFVIILLKRIGRIKNEHIIHIK